MERLRSLVIADDRLYSFHKGHITEVRPNDQNYTALGHGTDNESVLIGRSDGKILRKRLVPVQNSNLIGFWNFDEKTSLLSVR